MLNKVQKKAATLTKMLRPSRIDLDVFKFCLYSV